MQPFLPDAPTMVVDGATLPISHFVELNGYNLASHTIALEQSVLGKPHLSSTHNDFALRPPTVCGKRSRSNSDASSSSSSATSASNHASVFSPDDDSSDSAFGSQFSVGEQTPSSSRKGSISQHDQLADWPADVLAASHAASQSERERCVKRIRQLEGKVVKLASEFVTAASQPATSGETNVAPASAAPKAVSAPSISPASSSSSSSSSTDSSKTALVDCLVDASCRTLDRIWNTSAPAAACDLAKGKDAFPLPYFVRETLRRGRTSCSTLQAALLYCVRLGQATEESKQLTLRQSTRAAGIDVEVEDQACSPLHGMTKEELCIIRCPRRMFLASVITASKFVQDRCYSNKAWSKISGLTVKDLGKLERAFLKAIDYRLMVSDGEWESWTAELKRAHSAQNVVSAEAGDVAARRSSLSRSQSDNVSNAAISPDTELRAASPFVPSQVQPKYRHVGDAQQPSLAQDIALPFPRAAGVVSAEI